MGSNNSKTKINYEDVQNACKHSLNNNGNDKKYAIINTLDKNINCLADNLDCPQATIFSMDRTNFLSIFMR
jgi:hypothetical protein